VHRGELAVHHDDTVGADRDCDISTGAFQQVSLVSEIGGFYLDLGEIDVLLRARGSCK
jgi:hypothetical protein